jgi:hypothetical protein
MVMREDDKYSNLSSSSNIAYWDRDAWSRFIKDSIIPLHDHAQRLINFYSYLCNFNNQPVNKVFKEWSGAEKALLGGVEFDENNYQAQYSERSLAKIYKELLGFSVNINAYFSYKIQGLEPNILCTVEEEKSIMSNVKNILSITFKIIDLAIRSNLIEQHDSNANIDDLIAKPENIVDELYRLFSEKCMHITVGYNDYMNFVWSIRKITRKYLYALYPELKDKDKFEAIKEILGLNTLFKPEVEDEKLKEEYEILAFLDFGSLLNNKGIDPSLGGLLCKLNLNIWYIFKWFNYQLGLLAEPLPYLSREYFEHINEELKTKWSSSVITERIISYYLTSHGSSWPDEEYTELYISGPLIKSATVHYHLPPSLQDKKQSYRIDELNAPLFIVLDELMPAVSVGKYEIVVSGTNTFRIYDNTNWI